MKIAIDCRNILNPGFGEGAGIGHYTYYLVRQLLALDRKSQYLLFFDTRITDDAIDAIIGSAPQAKAVRFPFHDYRHALPLVYSHLLLAGFVARYAPDIYHVPGGLAPAAFGGRTVVTVHDLAIYRNPKWFPKQLVSRDVLYPRMVRSAAAVIAVSRATKRDIVKRFKVPGGRVFVIHPGVDVAAVTPYAEDVIKENDAADAAELAAKYRLARPYIMFIGTLEPRKNVTGLVRAYLAAWRRNRFMRGYDLLIAGAPGWEDRQTLQAIEEARRNTRGQVRHLGYVPHREKFGLMRGAALFCFPTFHEGFGLPVLEAMALGVPVLTSDIPVIRELAGSAVARVNPKSASAMADAICSLLRSDVQRAELARRGIHQVRQYRWNKTALETLRVYRACMKSTKTAI